MSDEPWEEAAVGAASTLSGTPGRDVLIGDDGDDVLFGRAGDDRLNGGRGNNTLVGGAGDDTYELRHKQAHDVVVERAGQGIDTVASWKSCTLSAWVENLELRSAVNWQYGRGNERDNRISAGAGTQALDGRGGDDVLTGGSGADTFSFGTGSGEDRITDLEPGVDRILLWDPAIRSYQDLAARMETVGDDVRIGLGAGRSILIEGVSKGDLDAGTFALAPLPEMVATFADEFDHFDPSSDGPWIKGSGRGSPYEIWYRGNAATEQLYVTPDYTGTGPTPLGVNPFSLRDGKLTISATRVPDELSAQFMGKEWVSGRLTSYETFEQRYGYFEMRAKLPAGQGFWPAFWLAPADRSWPPEIDVFEMLGKEPFVVRNSVSSEYWGFEVAQGRFSLVPSTDAGFHTYGMLWSPQTISFRLDGRELFELPTPADMHQEMAIIANLAVGGNWGGATDASTPDRGQMQIDYIRAYRVPSFEGLSRATGPSEMVDAFNGILRRGVSSPIEVYGDDPVRLDGATANYTVGHGEAVVGNALANRLTGDEASTTLNGRGGNDVLRGLGGDDILLGEAGGDRLIGGPGLDHLAGGMGNDTYVFARGDGGLEPNDEIINERGGEGLDTIEFSAGIGPDDVNMWIEVARLHIAVGAGAGDPEYLSVKLTLDRHGHDVGRHLERVRFADGTEWSLTGGLRLDDTDASHVSSGSRSGDAIQGNAGDDRLAALDGSDTLDGGAGDDFASGGDGNDLVLDTGAGGSDTLYGDGGNDTLVAGTGADRLYGGAGEDRLVASADGDRLSGGAGADRLAGGSGHDDFVFDADAPGTGADRIEDFLAGDAILLVAAAFDLPAAEGFRSEYFEMGTATSPETRFVYRSGDRTLLFDPDGSGEGGMTALATFDEGVVLGPGDFGLL